MAIQSIRKEYGKYIAELGQRDKRIVALDGDLNESTQSIVFKQKIPERYFEMGIAEQNMVGVAAGLATCGKIPIAHSFAAFVSMRSLEQVRTTVSYPKLNVKFLVTHAGVSAGSAGATHHAIEDLSIMRTVPYMTVLVPGDVIEMKRIVDAALEYEGPVYIRLAKEDVEPVFDESYTFEIGKATVAHPGDDGTIVTTGSTITLAMNAAELLENEYGKSARVVHCASLKPFDKECIQKAAKETGKLLTVEEHSIIGGLGSAVSEVIAEIGVGKVKRIGIQDHFCAVGSTGYIYEKEGITVENIVNTMLHFN